MDKIFIHEVVDELETLMDMVRWTFSRFNSSDLFYGHGTDNPWDESKYLVYCLLNLPFDLPDSFLSSKLTGILHLHFYSALTTMIAAMAPIEPPAPGWARPRWDRKRMPVRRCKRGWPGEFGRRRHRHARADATAPLDDGPP